MEERLRKIGWCVLGLGVILLLLGIALAITTGAAVVPVLISSSILLNSIALTMLRRQKP